jgi:hypothetical protein
LTSEGSAPSALSAEITSRVRITLAPLPACAPALALRDSVKH